MAAFQFIHCTHCRRCGRRRIRASIITVAVNAIHFATNPYLLSTVRTFVRSFPSFFCIFVVVSKMIDLNSVLLFY